MALRHFLGLTLLCHGVIAGLLGPATTERRQAVAERSVPRKLHGRFLHITGAFVYLACLGDPSILSQLIY
jgi:endopolyphosphatase